MNEDDAIPGRDLDVLFSAAYDELKRLARKLKRGPGQPTLTPTALVHEAYVRLAAGQFRAESPQHLKFTVVQAMKFLLVDAARRQSARIRGGPDLSSRRVPLDELSIAAPSLDPVEVVAVSDALEALARTRPVAAQAFELQYFGGLTVAEIGSVLSASEKKAQRLLQLARAQLALMLAARQPKADSDDERRTSTTRR